MKPVQAVFDAVSTPRRRAILGMVWDDELSAGEIAARFDVSWPAISQNIRVLREAGLLKERREGNRRLYRADRRALGPLAAAVRSMWEQDLTDLKRLAEQELRERGRS
jgi:DNA-binding transcriptional ArsR family regulator